MALVRRHAPSRRAPRLGSHVALTGVGAHPRLPLYAHARLAAGIWARALSCRARACIVPGWRRRRRTLDRTVELKLKVVVHEAEEGGYWAEVPAIPGCATQGETFEELLRNLYEAVEGCLSVEVAPAQAGGRARVVEIAV